MVVGKKDKDVCKLDENIQIVIHRCTCNSDYYYYPGLCQDPSRPHTNSLPFLLCALHSSNVFNLHFQESLYYHSMALLLAVMSSSFQDSHPYLCTLIRICIRHLSNGRFLAIQMAFVRNVSLQWGSEYVDPQ